MFYIKLISKKELPKKEVQKWYKTVKKYAPSGVVTSVQSQLYNPKVFLPDVKLIHNFSKNEHEYLIPLTRNLIDREVNTIKQHWNKGNIVTSSEKIKNVNDKNIKDNSIGLYKELSTNIAKLLHNKWLDKKKKDGWKYAIRYSAKDKTHPLIKSWDELLDHQKEIDYDLPSELLGLFIDYLDQKST